MHFTISSIKELKKIVEALSSFIDDGYRVFLFSGDLGSGKTTLIQFLCESQTVTEPVTSPTFSLVNEYTSSTIGLLYHMDLYRMDKQEDLVQIGIEEYLDSGHLCLIEWPEVATSYFTMPHVHVKIELENNNIRTFIITTHDAVDA